MHMSVTMFDAASPPAGQSPDAARVREGEATMDLHEEGTSDLAPTTIDFEASESFIAGEEESVELVAAVEPETPGPCASGTLLAPGAVVHDRYLIEALIGSGGAALVYRARDMQSSASAARNVQVALKSPRPEMHDAERARMRLSHEHQHMIRLAHPNIVRALDLSIDSPPFFMTMELIEGRSLTAILRDAGKPLPAAFAQRVLRDCAAALAHAHGAGVVHGDFKPGNVFITRDQHAKVIDFGAAVAAHTAESRIAAGTLGYASPEVLSGETPEVRDDVFSFACVAYELFTGRHPFDRRPSLQARDEGVLPPRAWALSASAWLTLLSGLSWSREQRPPDVDAFANALSAQNAATAAEPSAAREVPLAQRELPDEIVPRQRGWGFFVFLACALAVTFIAVQRRNEHDASTVAAEAAPVQLAPAPTLSRVAATSLMGAPISSSGASDARALSTPAMSDAGSAAPPSPAPIEAARKKAAPPASEIVFESSEIVTSEGSIAAVFLIKRSQPLSGRTRVRWSAVNGTADAGIDFASNASGSVEFADGQAQRAIYVPLRNDLLKEDDENFVVRLHAPQGARLGKANQATATIRDDD